MERLPQCLLMTYHGIADDRAQPQHSISIVERRMKSQSVQYPARGAATLALQDSIFNHKSGITVTTTE